MLRWSVVIFAAGWKESEKQVLAPRVRPETFNDQDVLGDCLPAATRARATDETRYSNWDRARLSVVVPIGVIVAVAIVCIVVAVLSSAQRADGVAIQHEQQMLAGALRSRGERVLREVESIATSQSAIDHVRVAFDSKWTGRRIGNWLETFFGHDAIFIFDSNDQPLYGLIRHETVGAGWLHSVRSEISPVLDFMRGRVSTLNDGIRLGGLNQAEGGIHPEAAIIGRFLSRPAIIAAAAIGPIPNIPAARDNHAPILMSVKFINHATLADIASQLNMSDLHIIGDNARLGGNDAVYTATRLRALPGSQSSLALRSCAASFPSSWWRLPVSLCSPRSCWVTCGAPRRRSPPASRACAISPCTTRSAACPTASSSASGWKR